MTSWLTRLAVLGAIIAVIGGGLLLKPGINTRDVLVVRSTVRPDRLQIAEAGAMRHEHGGDGGDKVKHSIVPYADGTVGEVFYRLQQGTVSACQECYSSASQGVAAQMKSKANWNATGTAVLDGTVWRPDGSVWMEYKRLADGNLRRHRYTQQPDSHLFVTELIHEVGGKPPRPRPSTNQPAHPEGKTAPVRSGWFEMSAAAPAPSDPSTVRTMDSTFFYPSGKKRAHLQFQWNSGWWTTATSSSPSRYVEGYWRSAHPVTEFFREEDESLLFKIVDERDHRWVTYYRSDGSKDYAQLWLQKYNSETSLSYKLVGVDEYDLTGKIRRTLLFDEDGQAVSLVAVQTPQAQGTKVLHMSKAVSGREGGLIESFGVGTIWRNNKSFEADRQRRLYIGPVDRVVQPDGQDSIDKSVVEVDVARLKFPEKYPAYVEFAQVRSEFERESQEFLGQRNDSDPCRWYFKGEPLPQDDDDF